MGRPAVVGPSSMAGFTLVEALIATMLAALVGVLMIEALRISQGAYGKTVREEQAGRDLFVAQRALRRILESSSAPPAQFSGTSSELVVEAPPASGEGDPAISRYQLLWQRAEDKPSIGRLVVRWQPTDGDAAVLPWREEVLLESVASLQVSYLPKPGVDSGSSTVWLDTWQQVRHLPALVRINVGFAPGDPRKWPALVVAPQITDDPGCEFDVVAQDCRDPS